MTPLFVIAHIVVITAVVLVLHHCLADGERIAREEAGMQCIISIATKGKAGQIEACLCLLALLRFLQLSVGECKVDVACFIHCSGSIGMMCLDEIVAGKICQFVGRRCCRHHEQSQKTQREDVETFHNIHNNCLFANSFTDYIKQFCFRIHCHLQMMGSMKLTSLSDLKLLPSFSFRYSSD